jgi:hypothetical protein
MLVWRDKHMRVIEGLASNRVGDGKKYVRNLVLLRERARPLAVRIADRHGLCAVHTRERLRMRSSYIASADQANTVCIQWLHYSVKDIRC